MILVVARPNDENFCVLERPILKAVPIATAGGKSGAVSGAHDFLAFIRHEHYFSAQDMHKLVFV
jgi:hypothetical protein